MKSILLSATTILLTSLSPQILSAQEAQKPQCEVNKIQELLAHYNSAQSADLFKNISELRTTTEDDECMLDYLRNLYRSNYKFMDTATYEAYLKSPAVRSTFGFRNMWIMNEFEKAPSLTISKLAEIISTLPKSTLLFRNANGNVSTRKNPFSVLLIEKPNRFTVKMKLSLSFWGPKQWPAHYESAQIQETLKKITPASILEEETCLYDYEDNAVINTSRNELQPIEQLLTETTGREELVTYKLARIACTADVDEIDKTKYQPERIIIRKNRGALYLRVERKSQLTGAYSIQDQAFINLENDYVR